ncbi:XdhC family protein [Treponema pedis]|uniref:XdhC family protein n=1 Tax=Treponema pedis TaxID=409322 RepID=UPI003D1B82E8
MIKIIEEARSLVLKKIPFIAATIIFKHGSAPREVGATMLVTEEGGYAGTIGGGSQEYEVANHAVGLLKNKKNGKCQLRSFKSRGCKSWNGLRRL